MGKAIRTFIGVKASQRVTSNVARVIDRLEATGAPYRWEEPGNLHVTLNFVGDVPDIEVPEFCSLIKSDVESFAPFDMSLHGVDAFPETEQPRIVWVGVDEGSEPLKELNRSIGDVIHHWGVNRERREYVPHMTIGRLNRGGRWNELFSKQMHRLRNHDGGFCRISEVTIFSSYLEKSGPTYTPMATIKLRG